MVSLDVDAGGKYNSNYFPMGLLILREIIAKKGLQVDLFDINKYISQNDFKHNTLNDIAKCIVENNPQFVAFFTRCDILPNVLKMAERVKTITLDTTVILGGPGVYGNETDILNNFNAVDIIIRGEGEKTVDRLFCADGLKDMSDIPGLAFRKNGKLFVTKDVDLIVDLDSIPFAKRDETIRERDMIQIEAGRGCPYNCSYCSTSVFWERNYRTMSPKRVVDEIQSLILKYRHSDFTFLHDNLTVSEGYVRDLVEEIKNRDLHFYWGCCARIDNVNENIICMLKDGGCRHIFFGIESGSVKIQKSIGKNIDLETIYDNMDICEKYDMSITHSYVLGFPEETDEDVNDTLRLAIKLANYNCSELAQLNYLMPIPSTRITNENLNDLRLDENQILLMQNKYTDQIPGLELDLDYISKYPKIFSSFYKIPVLHSFDLYKAVYCFSHLILYYKKTLKILCEKYKIAPVDLFKLISQKCEDCDCHKRAYDTSMGGHGVCMEFDKFVMNIVPHFSEMDKFITKYETAKRNKIGKKEFTGIHVDKVKL